ncbi:hypothetical protein Ancab_008371 [Ancistrocladus abbreviatus]
MWRKNIEVLNITLDGQIRVLHLVAYDNYDQSGKRIAHNAPRLRLVNFTISSSHNKLVAIGCDNYVYLKGKTTAPNSLLLCLGSFLISSSQNKLVRIGCDDYVYLMGLHAGWGA